jgi:streptomycin 6-kinase
MDLLQLESLTTDHLAACAPELGLDAARLRVRYVLNWGGFVNRSFQVTDGRTRLHLKLAVDPEIRAGLRRFWEIGPLMARYRAPAPIAWIEAPPSIDGPLAEEVVSVVGRLHADRELAARLQTPGVPATCADVFRQGYAERFYADLEGVESEPPPFVPPATVAWLRGEAEAIDAAVAAAPAFGEAADAPTHGDLWIENLLVTPGGEWFLLDWDGLTLGDPALDWGMLFGPTRTDPRTAADRALPPTITSDPAVRERLSIYARASLLDWTLDPLSDWIDAGEAPEHVAEVRAEKERIHRTALDAYRRRYGADARRS